MPAFSEAIDEALEAITATLDGIDRIVDAETGLQELHAYLLTTSGWWIGIRVIDAAARDLHATAARLARQGFLRLARADHWGELNGLSVASSGCSVLLGPAGSVTSRSMRRPSHLC